MRPEPLSWCALPPHSLQLTPVDAEGSRERQQTEPLLSPQQQRNTTTPRAMAGKKKGLVASRVIGPHLIVPRDREMEVATSYTAKRMQEQSLFDLVERTAGYGA